VMLANYFAHYNFCRVHGSLRVTSAAEGGITGHIWELRELLASTMARIRIQKNAGPFKIGLSMVQTYIVTNGKSGGNGIIIPCDSRKQAETLCERLNKLNPSKDHEVWL